MWKRVSVCCVRASVERDGERESVKVLRVAPNPVVRGSRIDVQRLRSALGPFQGRNLRLHVSARLGLQSARASWSRPQRGE